MRGRRELLFPSLPYIAVYRVRNRPLRSSAFTIPHKAGREPVLRSLHVSSTAVRYAPAREWRSPGLAAEASAKKAVQTVQRKGAGLRIAQDAGARSMTKFVGTC